MILDLKGQALEIFLAFVRGLCHITLVYACNFASFQQLLATKGICCGEFTAYLRLEVAAPKFSFGFFFSLVGNLNSCHLSFKEFTGYRNGRILDTRNHDTKQITFTFTFALCFNSSKTPFPEDSVQDQLCREYHQHQTPAHSNIPHLTNSDYPPFDLNHLTQPTPRPPFLPKPFTPLRRPTLLTHIPQPLPPTLYLVPPLLLSSNRQPRTTTPSLLPPPFL
jgi:hypothetical protein